MVARLAIQVLWDTTIQHPGVGDNRKHYNIPPGEKSRQLFDFGGDFHMKAREPANNVKAIPININNSKEETKGQR